MATKASDLGVLQAIVSAYKAGETSLWTAASDATQTLIVRIGCARLSLWRFELDAFGGRGIRCLGVKLPGAELAADQTLLREEQYSAYFAALVRSGVFVVNDTRTEPTLQAMRGGYLEHNRIGALLDIAVAINGRAYGIVCCEHIGGPRQWTPKQTAAARALVTRAALLMAVELRDDLGVMVSVPIAPF